jgi:hypothetical protein
MATITIKLDIEGEDRKCEFDVDENAERKIETERQRSGRDRADVILDIVKRTLWMMEFNTIRKEVEPYAKKAGLSEEEILALPRMPAPKSS